ncbi:hypothetical protein JCM24511_06146 [Saitozyma sp. JCM 24511]|nr:hypothetical protein JCM24511_06146 [Saitozyma sp. JCM 24511]
MSHLQGDDAEKEQIVQFEHAEEVVPPATLEAGNVKKRFHANHQLDDAKRLLEEAGGQHEFSLEDRKRVLRKIDLFVCVPMCLVYWIQQLDKSSVSYAAVFDLQTATHLIGSQYSWLSSIGYIAQLVAQPLSSYALIVFPVKYWVMFNMISWGIVTICTAAATNWRGLMICRTFLGAFEATILPSFVLITQMWWTRREQSYRTIAYQISNSVASLLGPLISYGIGHVTEGIHPYQGIFLLMGAITLAFAPLRGCITCLSGLRSSTVV